MIVSQLFQYQIPDSGLIRGGIYLIIYAMKRYLLYLQHEYDSGPHGRLHFHNDFDTVEDARQVAAASGMHGYQIEDLVGREVVEKGLVGDLAINSQGKQ